MQAPDPGRTVRHALALGDPGRGDVVELDAGDRLQRVTVVAVAAGAVGTEPE